MFLIALIGVEADENKTYPWDPSCSRRRKMSLNHVPSENLVKHPDSNVYYALHSFIEDFPDIDINFQEIYQAKECPCAPGRFCVDTEYCRRDSIENIWGTQKEWPWDVNAFCFDSRSKWEDFAISIWPVVWVWIAFMLAAFGYTEMGNNARDFIFFRGIINVLAKCLPGNTSWTRSIKRSMRRNPRMERMIEERLQSERERRLQRRQREREQLRESLVNTLLPEERTLQVSDVLSNKLQINLMIKTKKFISPNTNDDLETGIEISDSGSLEGEDLCSICLQEIDHGAKVGDIACNHIFHLDCLKEWIKRNNCCPMCKYERIAFIKVTRRRNNLVTSDGRMIREVESPTPED